jgi:trk system potassium uptake protein TrkA
MMRLDKNALLLNKTMAEMGQLYPNLEARAICIIRKGKTIIPAGPDMYMKDDLVYLIAKPESIEKIKELGGKRDYQIKNAMILGGGRIGKRAALNLQNDIDLKLIEMNKERCFQLVDDLNRTMIINGNGNDINLLMDEGLDETDAFIALTDSSETNILACLHAHKQGVKKTIALVENVSYIDVSQEIGIDTIINKKLITASYIARFTLNANVTSSKWLSGIDAEVVEVLVKEGAPITKKPIMYLDLPKGVNIGGVIRNNEAYIAKGNVQIMPGDKVVAFTIPESANKLMKLFN